MAVDVGTAKGYLDLDISKFTSALTEANTAAGSGLNTIGNSFETGLNKIGGVMTSAGSTLTKTVTAPVVALGTAAVKTTADFDSAMSQVQALSGATGTEFDALRQKAIEMGSKTKFSATESAEAMSYMALAGWDTNQMLDGLEGIMNLAAASGEDLATTSDIVTDALTAFGLSASDSAHFADVLAKTAASSNTTVGGLGEAFKYVAPVAGALGYSVEDVNTALGLMANVGIKGSQAGTSLRQALNSMISPTDAAAAAMEKYGIEIANSDGTMKPLSEVMDILREKMGDLSEEEQAQAASTIFGTRAMSGMLGIINASDEDYKKLTDNINNADGAAQEMADTMLNNLSGQITILKSALEGLAIQIGDILMPYISKAVEWLQGLVEKLQNLTPEEKEQIIKIAAIAATIGPLLLVGGKLLTGIATMIKTFQTLKTGIAALKSGFSLLGGAIGGISAPVVAIIAVIVVLIAAFVNLWKNNEDFRNKITEIWNGIKEKFQSFAQGIVDRLNALGFDFENFGEVVKAIWDGFCSLLAPIFEGVFNQVKVILSSVLDALTGIFDIFIGIFTGNWDQAWQGVKEVFGAVWDLIKGTFESWSIAFRGIADTVLGWFGTNWDTVWTNIKEFFIGIWNGIKDFFTNVINAIKNVATTVWTAISSFFSTIWNGIKTVFTTVVTGIQTFLTNAWTAITTTVTTVFTAIYNFFASIWNTIYTTVSTVVTTIWNTIKTVFENIALTITEIILGISNIISNVFNAIKEFLKGNTEQAKEHIRQAWQTAYNLVVAIVDNIRNTISTVFNAIKSIIQTIMQAIQTIIETIWNAIKTVVTNVVNAIKTTISTVFEAIKSIISTIMNAIQTTIQNVWNAIKTFVTNLVNTVKTTVSTAFENMKSSVTNTINALKTSVTNIFNGIKDAISNAVDTAKQNAINAMTNAKNGVVNVWNNIKSTFTDIGKNIIQGIIDGIGNMVSSLYDSIKNALSGLVDKAKSALGISSPSKVFKKEIGKWLPAGIAEGFEDAMPDAISDMEDSINDGIEDMDVDNVQVNYATGIMDSMSMVAEYFESIQKRLVDAVNGMKESLAYLVQQGAAVINPDGTLSYVGYNGFAGNNNRNSLVNDNPQSNNNNNSGGNTYIFNSPKAIDEIEAARQLRKTQRDISEGF